MEIRLTTVDRPKNEGQLPKEPIKDTYVPTYRCKLCGYFYKSPEGYPANAVSRSQVKQHLDQKHNVTLNRNDSQGAFIE